MKIINFIPYYFDPICKFQIIKDDKVYKAYIIFDNQGKAYLRELIQQGIKYETTLYNNYKLLFNRNSIKKLQINIEFNTSIYGLFIFDDYQVYFNYLDNTLVSQYLTNLYKLEIEIFKFETDLDYKKVITDVKFKLYDQDCYDHYCTYIDKYEKYLYYSYEPMKELTYIIFYHENDQIKLPYKDLIERFKN